MPVAIYFDRLKADQTIHSSGQNNHLHCFDWPIACQMLSMHIYERSPWPLLQLLTGFKSVNASLVADTCPSLCYFLMIGYSQSTLTRGRHVNSEKVESLYVSLSLSVCLSLLVLSASLLSPHHYPSPNAFVFSLYQVCFSQACVACSCLSRLSELCGDNYEINTSTCKILCISKILGKHGYLLVYFTTKNATKEHEYFHV